MYALLYNYMMMRCVDDYFSYIFRQQHHVVLVHSYLCRGFGNCIVYKKLHFTFVKFLQALRHKTDNLGLSNINVAVYKISPTIVVYQFFEFVF